MSTAALTAKYRPQCFADVAGQETLKGILSRAAAEDRIAPAYLFSGTRGVGKTTVARILAKAVNCVQAPTSEPCNQCVHCRQITQGMAVDVIEIDGASNRGIDDARRIREDIGYAPMECRYKVFIIDEAHMLTKEASNALLKTLEEPPRNVAFILATTEPHKILPTIVSRCQHFTFKRLTQPGLVAHLERILDKEGRQYDPRALQLLARRAAGSVRDSMSLLGQVLALGRERLELDDVRSILGLAGHEVFFEVLTAVEAQDPLALNELLRRLLDQGLDLGFFLRELAQTWRNLFLLHQAGEAALPLLELTPEEGAGWLDWARRFSLTHIHAAWQLTLEGQRRVLTSLEPAMALELLLLNLAFLPSLVPLEQLGAATPGTAAPVSGGGLAPQNPAPQRPAPLRARPAGAAPATAPAPAPVASPRPAPLAAPAARPLAAPRPEPAERADQAAPARPLPAPRDDADSRVALEEDAPPWEPDPATLADVAPPAPQAAPEPAPSRPTAAPQPMGERSWEGFLDFAARCGERDGHTVGHLRHVGGILTGNTLNLRCMSATQCRLITGGEYGKWVSRQIKDYFGPDVVVEITEPDNRPPSKTVCKDELESNPLVRSLQQEFGARIVDWGPLESPTG